MNRATLTICPTEKPVAKRYIARCKAKGCKTVVAFDCPTRKEKRQSRYMGQVTSEWIVDAPMENCLPAALHCVTHRRQIFFAPVKGVVTDHVCNAKCTTATGPNCECSCGGANHGENFLK